ncbi:MAG: hypothetical protein EP330_12515 [Deltaproteobacteria bacterium]|nr:MAG: hypothetical protein EP330_12515 [Deltaproteobacteria bacterium]
MSEDTLDAAHRAVRAFAMLDIESEPADAVILLFEQVLDLLPSHFADEVRDGGFFDHLRSRLPERKKEIDALAREHMTLLALGDAVADDLDGRDLDASLRARIREFATRLAHHEFRENALALEASGGGFR